MLRLIAHPALSVPLLFRFLMMTESALERWTLGNSGRSHYERGFGGKQVEVPVLLDYFSGTFLIVFFDMIQNGIFLVLGPILESFLATFEVYFRDSWK